MSIECAFYGFLARDADARTSQAGKPWVHDAVDQLQADAVRDGLIKQIGQDAVQQIMADAFAPYQHALCEQDAAS